MDGFELNKVFAAVLVALLVGMGSGMVGNHLISPKVLEKNAFPIEGVEEEPSDAQDKGGGEALAPIEPLLAKADVESGKIVVKKCLQCHTLQKGEPHKIGPNLWGVVQRKIGDAAGFPYSEGMKSLKGSWDVESLNKFLHKPREFVKGTKMSFVGLKKDKERADLIAYLKSLS